MTIRELSTVFDNDVGRRIFQVQKWYTKIWEVVVSLGLKKIIEKCKEFIRTAMSRVRS
jgi:hypothetical protein